MKGVEPQQQLWVIERQGLSISTPYMTLECSFGREKLCMSPESPCLLTAESTEYPTFA